jgi:hypothetical protein
MGAARDWTIHHGEEKKVTPQTGQNSLQGC